MPRHEWRTADPLPFLLSRVRSLPRRKEEPCERTHMTTLPRTAYRSEYFVILNGAILMSCCAKKCAALHKEWNVLVLNYEPHPRLPLLHCGEKCLKRRGK